jgi:hypothetical protein
MSDQHATPTCITGEPCPTRSGCYCKNCREYRAAVPQIQYGIPPAAARPYEDHGAPGVPASSPPAGLYPPCPDCGERTYYGPDGMPRCPDCYDPDDDFDQQEPIGCPVCGEDWDYDCNGNPRCAACDPPCPCCHDSNCGGDHRVVGDNEGPDAVPNDVDADDVGPGACAWCGTHAPLSTFTSGGRHITSPYVTARLRAFCSWSCHQSYHG